MTKAVFLPLSVFLLVGVPPSSTATDYCNFTSDHVLCGNKGYGPKCGDPSQVTMISVDSNTRAEILDLHNSLRNNVASGNFNRDEDWLEYPAASNMEELVWDTELESIAKAVSKKCSAEPSCKDCIRVDRFLVVGENIHHSSSGGPEEWKAVMDRWIHFKIPMINDTNISSKKNQEALKAKTKARIVHIISARTTHIGCARVTFKSEAISVCHYGEGRSVVKDAIYSIGNPCTSCAGGRGCSSEYPNLCTSEGRKVLKQTESGTITLNKMEAIILLTSLITLAFP